MRIVSFVAASSNSGKTTLIEKVVVILKARGLRVAVVKHASAGFELDKPGKDSWRFRQAGAAAVVLVGPDSMALVKDISREPSREDLMRLFADVDIAIQEGFKHSAVNRIEVFRSGVSGDRPLCLSDHSYLALVSDHPIDVAIPRFDWNDAEGVADFIMNSRNIS
jgi:molybdopterin-guanine dinucleotide biosynthesis adapter protein